MLPTLDLLPPSLRAKPPFLRCRPSGGRSSCVAAALVADGQTKHARDWANRLSAFPTHLVHPVRIGGPGGPRVVESTCPTCCSLQSGESDQTFELLPWVVDHRGRSMPLDALGPLSPRKENRAIAPMPAGWQSQMQAIADAFSTAAARGRREPTTRVEQLTDAVAERTGCTIPVGVFLAGAVTAGCGFGISRDDHPKLMIDIRDLTLLLHGICERSKARVRDTKMTRQSRTMPTAIAADPSRVLAFVGGRQKHNRRRQIAAAQRRKQVLAKMLQLDGLAPRGWQSDLARELGVARSTISSDIASLQQEYWQRRRARRRGRPQ